MDNNFLNNQNRSFGAGAANTTGQGKGRSGSTGEGSNEPLMRIAPTDGPSSQNQPVAEPLVPHELGQMVSRIGSLVYNISAIAEDLRKALDNPSVKTHQKVIIITVIKILKPISRKIFNAGLKLSDAFLPYEKK